ncbi:TVG0244352 [Thermoplasma volcanium GSS1]|uniref:TVG0244352 protein n=1 Tax=Thermoplasma volcanium (strain ATCC 51530 / DSM 4299 / JCM 9571 / NBRC 15438 / GSS1) TaxID=273116 RepID=Q97C70_THEVO|nr:TVG0244352 [Thermoplasma volcanium GSS1]
MGSGLNAERPCLSKCKARHLYRIEYRYPAARLPADDQIAMTGNQRLIENFFIEIR